MFKIGPEYVLSNGSETTLTMPRSISKLAQDQRDFSWAEMFPFRAIKDPSGHGSGMGSLIYDEPFARHAWIQVSQLSSWSSIRHISVHFSNELRFRVRHYGLTRMTSLARLNLPHRWFPTSA